MKSIPLEVLAHNNEAKKFSMLKIVVSVEDGTKFVLLRPGILGFSIQCSDYKDVSKFEPGEHFVDPKEVFYTCYDKDQVIVLISPQALEEGGWDLKYIHRIL